MLENLVESVPLVYGQTIYLMSFIYVTIMGVLGVNYLVTSIMVRGDYGSKMIHLGLLLISFGIFGIVPFTFIGTYVVASVQTRKQIEKTEQEKDE